MIDFHTHILPHMDDGSRDTDMTMRMLAMEMKDGVDIIVSTSHFYAEENRVDEFLHHRQAMCEHVLHRMEKEMPEETPAICLGAEVCYFPGMSESAEIDKLCIEGTNVMLLELPFEQWTKAVYKDVKALVEKHELTVVLAHLERFPGFQKDKAVYESVCDLPVHVQCNAGPLLKMMKRGEVIKMFKSGRATLLGSDCHNDSSRAPNLLAGRDMLKKKIGEKIPETIDAAGETLLKEARMLH